MTWIPLDLSTAAFWNEYGIYDADSGEIHGVGDEDSTYVAPVFPDFHVNPNLPLRVRVAYTWEVLGGDFGEVYAYSVPSTGDVDAGDYQFSETIDVPHGVGLSFDLVLDTSVAQFEDRFMVYISGTGGVLRILGIEWNTDPVVPSGPARMRHRQRHVHATILRHVRETLTETGWIDTPVNWGQPAVTVLDYEPQEAGETPPFNTVAVSIGHQGSDDAIELGGGVQECQYTVFIDVYPTNESIGVAIADDIKDAINDEYLAMRDFTTSADGVVRDDMYIEFENVLVETIPSATSTLDKRSWRSVKATAVCYF